MRRGTDASMRIKFRKNVPSVVQSLTICLIWGVGSTNVASLSAPSRVPNDLSL